MNLKCLLSIAVAMSVIGCRFAAPKPKTRSGQQMREVIVLTPNQIRLQMRGLVGPMCGEIEQTADQIIAESTNSVVQRAALEWKIQAVPEMREALFQPDPLTALIDTWVLCYQMAEYFETGQGKTSLGDSSPTAAATCRALEESLAGVAIRISASGDVSKVRAEVRQWATDHPIKHSIAGRETTLSRVLDRDAAPSLSTGEVIVDMTTALDDLNRKLEVYAQQLMQEARWETDLLKMQIRDDWPLDQAVTLAERVVKSAEEAAGAASRLPPTLDRVVTIAEHAEKLISSEREAVIKTMHEELIRTIQFMQDERVAALAHLTKERTAAFETLGESFEMERKLFTKDLDRMGLAAVDHAFWRAAQLAAFILVGFFVAAILLLLITRRLFAPVRPPRVRSVTGPFGAATQ